MRIRRLIIPFAAIVVLAACATAVRVAVADRPAAPLPAAALELAQPGDAAFNVRTGTMKGVYGCPVAYEAYLPSEPRTGIMVLLGHGFMRDLTHMRGWARLWASYGVPTAIMTFCNSSLAAGNHDRNAEDMMALAAQLHDGPVVYAGFSAGGLAALISASRDPRAVGYLGLDPVDSGGLAAPAAARLTLPGLFLEGDPSSCNAQGNMAPLVPVRAGVAAVRVLHSVHCLFEDPSDSACAALCGSVEPEESRRDVADTIHVVATAWILHAAGIGGQAAAVLDSLWTGGDAWKGRVVVLRAPGA